LSSNSTTILLTGATGFIGSHLAEDLAFGNYRVIALVRNNSDLWRCKEFNNDNIVYVNVDKENFKETLSKFTPSVLIHAAWQGVAVKKRNEWNVQVENVTILTNLLILAQELGIKKMIGLGSQAEYGIFSGRINEDAPCNPVSAYGAAKMASLNIFKAFCESNSIDWIWLRLFSFYGTRENPESLIPSVIRNISHDKPMDLTPCEQRYDYLYIKDFTKAISKILEHGNKSGVFNLSSNSSVRLKEIIVKIRNAVNPNAVLKFGALPYRPNQIMHMEGDSTKFNSCFNFHVESGFEKNLNEVVRYYSNK